MSYSSYLRALLATKWASFGRVMEKCGVRLHSHYFKDVSHLDAIDVYRVLELFGVVSPPIQHAVKKLLCSGERGVKDQAQDVDEAIDSLQRWKQMREEDARRESF